MTEPPKTLAEAAEMIAELLPDNTAQEISAADVRAAFDIILAVIGGGVDE